MKYLIQLAMLLCLSASAMANDIPERDQIAEELKWDLTSMYESAEAWEADAEKYEAMLLTLDQYKGTLGKSGKHLLAAIKASEEINMLIGDLYVYAGMKSFEDLRNGENSARFSRARAMYAKYGEATAYFRPELMAIPEKRLKRMVEKTPDLNIYRHSMDEMLRLRDYTLAEEMEKLLAAASDPLAKFQTTFGALNNADMTFGEIKDESGELVPLTNSRYGTFVYSEDRGVREAAWKGLHSQYEKMGNTLAANYEGHVKSRIFLAKARGFDSALEAATYNNAIPLEVYTTLIDVTRQGSPLLQRYLKLREKALGVDKLQIWDMYAPISEPTLKDIPWEEAKQIVADGLEPLGEEYVSVYWKGFDEGWVDAYENQGKRGGAYSWGTYRSKPYMSMNYDGTINDVSTLAHEYGHSIHSYLARNAQPYVYGDYRTFIAEIASMTNEAILFQKMLQDAESKADRIFLLQTYLDQFRGSFFRQTSFADFEMQAHAAVEAGQALNKEALNKIYADVFHAYYGDAVHADELNASEWSRIPHFLRTDNFYVYQYSTSFAAATALAKMILDEGEPARERFLTMLKSGSNDYPIELLKKAGIDMTTPEPLHDTLAVFEDLIDQLEAELN